MSWAPKHFGFGTSREASGHSLGALFCFARLDGGLDFIRRLVPKEKKTHYVTVLEHTDALWEKKVPNQTVAVFLNAVEKEKAE